jgi:Ca-activated chloride channel family protein
MQTLNVQDFGVTQKYLVGKYDMEILCMPRLYINDVHISQDSTTLVEIPQSGIAVIQLSANGYGSVYQEDNNKLKWIYNLPENTSLESLYLLPGKYRVVFRTKFTNRSSYSVEKSFIVNSGSSVTVKMFQD